MAVKPKRQRVATVLQGLGEASTHEIAYQADIGVRATAAVLRHLKDARYVKRGWWEWTGKPPPTRPLLTAERGQNIGTDPYCGGRVYVNDRTIRVANCHRCRLTASLPWWYTQFAISPRVLKSSH